MADASVGEHVRVTSLDGGSARLAYVTSVNDDKAALHSPKQGGGSGEVLSRRTFDVIYCKESVFNAALINASVNSTSGADEEESDVVISRVSSLMPWELEPLPHSSISAAVCKDRGNALFSLKDFSGSFYWYHRGAKQLEAALNKEKLSVGSDVLVQLSSNKLRFVPAMVDDILEGGFVSLTLGSDCDSESFDRVESGRISRLMQISGRGQLAAITADRVLQRSLYMNLAKSASKLLRHGWSVKYSCLARGITDSLFELVAEKGVNIADIKSSAGFDLEKFRMDEYSALVKSLLSTNRYALAQTEADAYLVLPTSTSASPAIVKARQLIAEVDNYKKKLLQSNRQLAKEVSIWVDKAMTSSKSRQSDPLAIEEGESYDDDSLDKYNEHTANEGGGSMDNKEECVLS